MCPKRTNWIFTPHQFSKCNHKHIEQSVILQVLITFINSYHKSVTIFLFSPKMAWGNIFGMLFHLKTRVKKVLGKGKPSSKQMQCRLNFLPQIYPPNMISFKHTSSSPELPYILTGAGENSRSGLLQLSLQRQLAKVVLFLLEKSWLKSNILSIAHMKILK